MWGGMVRKILLLTSCLVEIISAQSVKKIEAKEINRCTSEGSEGKVEEINVKAKIDERGAATINREEISA